MATKFKGIPRALLWSTATHFGKKHNHVMYILIDYVYYKCNGGYLGGLPMTDGYEEWRSVGILKHGCPFEKRIARRFSYDTD